MIRFLGQSSFHVNQFTLGRLGKTFTFRTLILIGFLPLLSSGTDWVDPEDPTDIAESELPTAAKSIEAAAQKLSQLKPRKKAKVGN